MAETYEDILSPLIDGEAINRAAVLDALDSEAGRACLIDLARLRAVAAAPGDPSPAFYDRMARLADDAGEGTPRRRWKAAVALAASMLIGSLATTAWHWRPGAGASVAPPAAARVLEFASGVDWQETRHEVVR
jgi:hypothetical protein